MLANDVFRELDSGKFRPVYLIVGEEPFQVNEILHRFRQFFAKKNPPGEGLDDFRTETWDGEGMAFDEFRSSLEELPGLFSEGPSTRFLICQRYERVSPAHQEKLEAYFENPNPDVCLVLCASKADKRKAWIKTIEKAGAVITVEEPKYKDWTKWRGYLEKKLGKRLGPNAWERSLEEAGHALSLVASDLERAALYVGSRPDITEKDVMEFSRSGGWTDLFAFVDDVAQRKKTPALLRYHALVRAGEAELKLLSLLVRQFRLMDKLSRLVSEGAPENSFASELGVPPFAVSKFKTALSRQPHGPEPGLRLLAETDYLLKTGKGSLFDTFLVPYFA